MREAGVEDARRSEVDILLGDASKARVKLGCGPKVGFEELVRLMVDADITTLEDSPSARSSATATSAEVRLRNARRS